MQISQLAEAGQHLPNHRRGSGIKRSKSLYCRFVADEASAPDRDQRQFDGPIRRAMATPPISKQEIGRGSKEARQAK